MPKFNVVIDQINGKDVNPDDLPVLQARQSITLSGHIEDMNGNKATAFNGQIESTLFDCEQSVSFSYTYQYYNPQTGKTEDRTETLTYEDRKNKLALNVNRVTNGNFTITTTIPSEVYVSYDNYRPSLISLYAYDQAQNKKQQGLAINSISMAMMKQLKPTLLAQK